MNFQKLLYAIVLAAMLASLLVVPVTAGEEPIEMWVSRVRLAYNGRSPHGPDRVVGLIHVRDATLAAVEGATVTAEWTLPDGTVVQDTAVTAFQGIAQFSVWEGRGTYQICVLDVAKTGWLYVPQRNLQTCATFIVP